MGNISIQNGSFQDPLTNCFGQVTLIFTCLWLMNSGPLDVCQFTCEENYCPLGTGYFLTGFVYKPLEDRAFPDYSSASHSASHFALVDRLQSYGCHSYLLEWLSDHHSHRHWYVKSRKRQSIALTSDSGVIQGVILSLFLFFQLTCYPSCPFGQLW